MKLFKIQSQKEIDLLTFRCVSNYHGLSDGQMHNQLKSKSKHPLIKCGNFRSNFPCIALFRSNFLLYMFVAASRSFSSCFSKSWSASKQIQAMSTNLMAPRGGESTGLALPVYAMSSVLVFVMWTLVTAVPCQERAGLGTHFQLPRHLVWAQPIIGLQEKIGDEWKKKEKKGTAGLLAEIQVIEKVAQNLVEFSDGFEFPVGAEKTDEVAAQVAELAEICRKMEVGLGPLQLQVRELFHRMVRSRAEVLDVMEHVGKINTPVPY